ncbi:MAG: DUF3105 domain-containing protein [Actinomycetota bacterium]
MSDAKGPEGRKPTKAERKEQARIEREELQRKEARRSRMRVLGIGLVAAALAIAVGLAVLLQPDSVDLPSSEELLAQSDAAIEQAECTPADNVGPYQPETSDSAHIGTESGPPEMPPLSTYASVPPTSGPHAPVTQGAGVYDSSPPIDQVLHSLEHGAVVIWYDPAASGPELQKIKDFYADEEFVIVAPYDYSEQGEAGRLPAGVEMAVTAWHFTQECADLSLAASYAFVDDYRAIASNDDYQGEAPEPGAAI